MSIWFWIILAAVILLGVLPLFFLPGVLYSVLLVRIPKSKWKRECSMPDDEEIVRMFDTDDFARRIKQMENGATSTLTLQETTASRAYSVNELSCKEGDEICLLGGELICVKNNMTDCIRSGLTLVPDMDEKEMCIVFRGKDADEDAEDDVREIIEESWPGMEVEFVYGGQEIYHWIIGIS